MNKTLLDAVSDLDHVTVRDLYAEYPNHFVDVEKEKQLLTEHDVILFQHPFYWYSCPPLMKTWIDLVLEYGWAYGKNGNALEGKYWLQAVTIGGGKEAYQPDGQNHYSVEDFLKPFFQTARLCHMTPVEPFIVYGSLWNSSEERQTDAERYRDLLTKLGEPDVTPSEQSVHIVTGET